MRTVNTGVHRASQGRMRPGDRTSEPAAPCFARRCPLAPARRDMLALRAEHSTPCSVQAPARCEPPRPSQIRAVACGPSPASKNESARSRISSCTLVSVPGASHALQAGESPRAGVHVAYGHTPRGHVPSGHELGRNALRSWARAASRRGARQRRQGQAAGAPPRSRRTSSRGRTISHDLGARGRISRR